jgi:hypothetical protein
MRTFCLSKRDWVRTPILGAAVALIAFLGISQ